MIGLGAFGARATKLCTKSHMIAWHLTYYVPAYDRMFKQEGSMSRQNAWIESDSLNFSQGKSLNPVSTKPTKWLSTLKQFVSNKSTNCLSAFDHFVWLVLKGLSTKDM